MSDIIVELVDAFVDGGIGGNPAGVVTERGESLSLAQKQAIAAQAGLSETAFVLPSESADFKLEFFTPTRSIPHCGHATVASFARLAQLGRLKGNEIVNETVDGPRRIRIEGQSAFLEQVPARFETLPATAADDIAASLGIISFLPGTPRRRGQVARRHAALIRPRKLSTSLRSNSASRPRWPEAPRTSAEA